MEYKPVIIIGAPRSGTNMLRDMLTELPGVGTWPCDEINYIWRHGNVRYLSDEFTTDMASPEISQYIRNKFDVLAKSWNLDTVIEKTCANSMRVGFVDKILPNARYIFMARDGLDVVGSAMLRWKADLDIPYLIKKARFVPLSDLPFYASRYFVNRIHRLLSSDKQLAFWGPQMNNMGAILSRHNLFEVCGLQWQTCVESSQRDFDLIEPERVIKVRYETFVQQPEIELQRISKFIDKPMGIDECKKLTKDVSNKSVGKGRESLSEEERGALRPLIGNTLGQYGYSV